MIVSLASVRISLQEKNNQVVAMLTEVKLVDQRLREKVRTYHLSSEYTKATNQNQKAA